MDVIDSIKKDKAYLKCKLIVKNWEKEFKSNHGRTPSKFDIKESSSKIKYAYKKYFQLKSAALESSLCIDDFEEAILGSPEPIRHFESLACESLSSQTDQILPDLPSGQEIQKLLANIEEPRTSTNISSPFTDNLSKKLFQNRKFSIRNPRKSSQSKSQNIFENTQGNEFEKENSFLTQVIQISPPKETNLKIVNKGPESLDKHVSSVSNIMNSITKVRQVDRAWLERVTGSPVTDTKEICEPVDKYGISNVKVSVINIQSIDKEIPEKQNESNYDYVENSESEEEDNIALVKLKPALKKRKISNNMSTNLMTRHNASITNKNEINMKEIKQTRSGNPVDNKIKRKLKSKNYSNDNELEPPDISEFLPFGKEDDIAPRHGKISNILEKIDNPVKMYQATTKIVAQKEVDKLESKIKNGTLNDNFVKINIEKKVFVRGKKNLNFSKYKKQQWKDKKALHAGMEFPEAGKIACFKCGVAGHMARYCTAHRGDSLLPLDSYSENILPSLEDMQNIVSKDNKNMSLSEQLSESLYEPSKIPDSVLKMLEEDNCTNKNVKPVFSHQSQEIPSEMQEALLKFGHDKFRPGQEEAIKRILCGLSTLLILSTGGGKSLCYQLPAYIYSKYYKCITLVISPLVSLMEDQVLSMPDFLKAGCLHTNQPPTHRRKIIQCLKDGELNILLVSPEALISGDSSNGFTGLFKSLPQIAFACIDEAHCVSQWSHNFRPSYLMISRVLREKLNVRCILGLTATASQPTIKSIISHINIPDGISGVITSPTLPKNLILSVSYEKDKDRALVSFLSSDRISLFNSIIVYCIRRDECERVAAVLRSCLQEPHKINMEKLSKKRKRMSYIAEAYHAGMSAAQRKKIQKHFMDGTLRIIVATVAFGMGINKSDIRCIIHYNMPSSFESYVQEVGRAGRDGQNAYCHVFMNNSDNDKNELLKHVHANTIDRPTIRKLIQKLFIPCECLTHEASTSKSPSTKRCKGHEVGIPIDSTVEELDLPAENIATLLCYVELHPKGYIKVLNNAYTMCKISSYGGPVKIIEAAKTCSPLAMAYLLESKNDPDIMNKSCIEFNVIEVAAALGLESGMTKYHLKNLEWIAEGGLSRRSLLKVEFSTLGFRIKAPGDLNPLELDEILDDLHKLVLSQERSMLYQLEEINKALSTLGNYSLESSDLSEELLYNKSDDLKIIIKDYFQRDDILPSNLSIQERPIDIDRVASDVRALVTSYKDCSFTGRSIARIFQGISSPNYPALVWGRCKFWRSHIQEDFYGILKIATQELIQMKMI